MKTKDSRARAISEALGAAVLICWTLILGPIGAILLLALADAMVSGNSVLIVACALPLLSPLALVLVWGILAWTVMPRRDETEKVELTKPLAGLWPEEGQTLTGERSSE